MNIETKEYLRTILSEIDGMSCEINEIIEDDFLQDDEEFVHIYDAISNLQFAIDNYQELNKYI